MCCSSLQSYSILSQDEARIVDSVARGKVASTLEQNSWIDLGNFKGEVITCM